MAVVTDVAVTLVCVTVVPVVVSVCVDDVAVCVVVVNVLVVGSHTRSVVVVRSALTNSSSVHSVALMHSCTSGFAAVAPPMAALTSYSSSRQVALRTMHRFASQGVEVDTESASSVLHTEAMSMMLAQRLLKEPRPTSTVQLKSAHDSKQLKVGNTKLPIKYQLSLHTSQLRGSMVAVRSHV